MKELSIEQKAKRYDEALEKSKRLYEQGTITESLAYIFPELKKSEDEKIRKDLIIYLRSILSNKKYGDKFIEGWIAWLEKLGKCEIDCPQNHQDSSYPNGCIVLEDFNGGEGFYKVHLDYLNKKQVEEVEEMVRMWNKESKTSNRNIKNCIEMCLADANEQRFKDYGTNLKDCLSWLEKQGEQKPQGKSALEAAKEEKVDNADKIEPKFNFKVSQWIVATGKCVYLIAKIDGFNVTLVDTNGDKYVFDASSLDDAHEWTIEDAKNGDVLFQDLMGGKTFIYNGVNPDMAILYSFIISNDGEDVLPYHIGKPNTGIGTIEENKNIIHPATKEQRDLLFQKMHEAGYEWDGNKKELRKIEQKPTDKEMKELLRTEYEKGRADAIAEMQKPWSEEDELKRTTLIDVVKKQRGSAIFEGLLPEELTDWLKSLKERVQPQNSSVTDEELAQAKKEAYNEALDKIEYNSGEPTFDDGWSAAIWYLRKRNAQPQNTWKPSGFHLECISDAIAMYQERGINAIGLKEILEELKKLKEE